MKPSVVIATANNLEGIEVVLIQQGNTYMVGPSEMFRKECKHDEGFTFKKVKPDLYGYACSCSCGFVLEFDPASYPSGVVYREHVASPEDKVLPPIAWKEGEH